MQRMSRAKWAGLRAQRALWDPGGDRRTRALLAVPRSNKTRPAIGTQKVRVKTRDKAGHSRSCQTACYVTVNMAIVSSSHVVVRRVMGCARSSGIDEGLHDNVNALLIQAPLNACNIAYGASCREPPLDQELRARGQRVMKGKARAPPRPRTLSARLARQKPRRAFIVGLAGPPHKVAGLGRAALVRIRMLRKQLKPLHTERGRGL